LRRIRLSSLFVLAVAFWAAGASMLAAQEPGLTLRLVPGVHFPVADSRSLFTLGGSIDAVAEYRLRPIPFLGARLSVGYQYLPIWTADSAQMVTAAAGLSFNVDPGERIQASLYGIGGYYRGFLVDGTGTAGGNAYLQGGLRTAWSLTPRMLIELDVSYRNNLQFSQGVSVSIGIAYRFLAGAPMELRDVEFRTVFPVLFKYYDEHPIGSVILRNPGSDPIEDISLHLFVEEFMVNPRQSEGPASLEPGEEAQVDLYALFSDSVLDVTEGTRVSARLLVSYTLNGEAKTDEHSATMTFRDRNAITWDDDRKVAAYVTAKDPNVLQFARSVAAWAAQQEHGLNSNLQKAIAIMEALRLHGVSYVIDPRTPYAELSASADAVDFLQFPQQTLRFTAGDCDDLCILYAAMLESVGVETAFVTTPGHISLAVSLGVTPEIARRTFRDADDLIYRKDTVWLPIEVTSLQRGFDRARSEGASRFRQYVDAGEVGFYPTHEAWAIYEPVGFEEPGAPIRAPEQSQVVAAFNAEVDRFIDREIFDLVAELERSIADSGGSPRFLNRLGVLYARYGRYDDARAQFQRILESDQRNTTAMVNLGNIHLLEGRADEAAVQFESALQRSRDPRAALVGLARSAWETGDFNAVRRWYGELKTNHPDTAAQFAYLDVDAEGSRAAGVVTSESLLWDEEAQ